MKSSLATAVFIGFTLVAGSALGAPDESLRYVQRQTAIAKQKLIAAQVAHGTERRTLMAQHMKMMEEIMGKIKAMAPGPGMSMQHHEEWIVEHQNLMQQLIEQMAGQHQM
ncbi:hypothetical protein [Pseudoduganella sp. UC29_106]|uniref:hypothetical protein n=1 Tax=Pseudoduganella sp. UC29_106 TaxID=3374553 RepID=UPI003756DD92